jgi:hypothetical protein
MHKQVIKRNIIIIIIRVQKELLAIHISRNIYTKIYLCVSSCVSSTINHTHYEKD